MAPPSTVSDPPYLLMTPEKRAHVNRNAPLMRDCRLRERWMMSVAQVLVAPLLEGKEWVDFIKRVW